MRDSRLVDTESLEMEWDWEMDTWISGSQKASLCSSREVQDWLREKDDERDFVLEQEGESEVVEKVEEGELGVIGADGDLGKEETGKLKPSRSMELASSCTLAKISWLQEQDWWRVCVLHKSLTKAR